MLKAILGKHGQDHPGLMREIFLFRHRQFVDRLGWKALRAENGLETDAFDRANAFHLPFTIDGRIVGYSRLLPTTEPHLLSHIYPELMNGQDWPKGERIYEWTRCAADPDAGTVNDCPVSNMLMTAIVEYLLVADIEGLIVETSPQLVEMLRWSGYDIAPLSPPRRYGEETLLVVMAVPTRRTMLRHRQVYGIDQSLLAPQIDLPPFAKRRQGFAAPKSNPSHRSAAGSAKEAP